MYEEEVEEMEEVEEQPAEASRLVRFGKKAAWSLSIAVASLLVFTGVLTLLIQLIDLSPGGKSEAFSSNSPKGTASPTAPAPTPTGSAKATPSPSPTVTPTPKPAGTPIPDIVAVPNLVGLAQATAEQHARDSGLRYTYYLEPNDGPAGTVFKQDLPANQQVAKGERVTFWISKGR